MAGSLQRLISVAAVALVAGFVFAGCGAAKLKPGEVSPCAAEGKIEKEIPPEAALEQFACTLKPWEGKDTLHFLVGIRNISDRPQRFRVNIFLDNGKAVGGLIPRSTKKGLVAPGQTASFEYPVQGMQTVPKSIVLIIRTMKP